MINAVLLQIQVNYNVITVIGTKNAVINNSMHYYRTRRSGHFRGLNVQKKKRKKTLSVKKFCPKNQSKSILIFQSPTFRVRRFVSCLKAGQLKCPN